MAGDAYLSVFIVVLLCKCKQLHYKITVAKLIILTLTLAWLANLVFFSVFCADYEILYVSLLS